MYAVITGVLHNEKEVEAYLAEREALADRVREECERAHPMDDIRARLLARKNAT